MGKQILRSELLRSLGALSEDEIQNLSLSLTDQIIKFLKVYPGLTNQIGASFMPFKAELAPMYQVLLHAIPLTLAFPILKGEDMAFAIPSGMPKGGTWLEHPYQEVTPQWLFVPGVGFDLSGGRLGRGKGFYDRYLENSKALKIGVAWSQQLKEKIPVESHDSHMDFIITEKFCWDVSQQTQF